MTDIKKLTAFTLLTAAATLSLSGCRNPLPLTLPPAVPGAVNAPDLTEAKKFFGTWQCTQQIHAPKDGDGSPSAFVTTRALKLIVSPDQRLVVETKEFTDTSTADEQSSRSGGGLYTARWAQQNDAQGKRLWVVQKGPDESPVGAYYRFGPADKNGQSTTLTLTAAASQNKTRMNDVNGAFTRVPEPTGPQPGQMRKRDSDALRRKASQ